MGHVALCGGCEGLGVVDALVPKPPPNWPTIISEVGTVPGRLLVSLIVSEVPVDKNGTEITTGDHVPTAAFEFRAAQVPALPATGAPQV